jgi:hypothetical protein
MYGNFNILNFNIFRGYDFSRQYPVVRHLGQELGSHAHQEGSDNQLSTPVTRGR